MNVQEQQDLLRMLNSFLNNFTNEFTDRDQDGELCCNVYGDVETRLLLTKLRRVVKKELLR